MIMAGLTVKVTSPSTLMAAAVRVSVRLSGRVRACRINIKNNLHKIIFTLLFWLFQFFRITLTL